MTFSVDQLVEREVIYSISMMMYELAKNPEALPSEYQEDMIDAWRGVPDYEEAAIQEGWTEKNGEIFKPVKNQYFLSVNLQERGQVYVDVRAIESPEQDDGKTIWEFSGSEEEAVGLDGSESFDVTDCSEVESYLIERGIIPQGSDVWDSADSADFETADSWEEACDIDRIEPYEPEVFEHWIVSRYLADRLEEKGERIIRDFLGFDAIWCRTTTGQAISMDGVIEEIHREMIAD